MVSQKANLHKNSFHSKKFIPSDNKSFDQINNAVKNFKSLQNKFKKTKNQRQIVISIMDSEPRWLDIDDELYPETLIMKQCIFENSFSGTLHEFYSEIRYNSFRREIDLTPLVFKYFVENGHQFYQNEEKNVSYEILIRDKHQEKIHLVGFFPNDDSFMLGEQFLSEDILYLIVRKQDKLNQQFQNLQVKQTSNEIFQKEMEEAVPQAEEKPKPSYIQEVQKEQEDFQESSKAKPNKRRTIEEVLKIIAEWRKLIMIKKLSSQQAADRVGMSKRSLEEYFTIIKLAEKYSFNFQGKMKNAFAELRTFVKDNHEIKPAPKVQILEKFKNNKK